MEILKISSRNKQISDTFALMREKDLTSSTKGMCDELDLEKENIPHSRAVCVFMDK